MKVSGHCFKVVVQGVFLFRAEMWFLTPRVDWTLSIFHHRVAQWLTGR